MNHFFTIDETAIDPSLKPVNRKGYTIREAVRAVVFDDKRRVALLRVTKDNYYKLPGGGVEHSEHIQQALERELLEEIGCKARISHKLGSVLEQRYFWKMTQVSHCYIAEVVGKKGTPSFTDNELADGFEVIWTPSLTDAIALLESSSETADSNNIGITFMRLRDVATAKQAALNA